MRSTTLHPKRTMRKERDPDPHRSAIMRAVPRFNSKPELAVRKFLHANGLRFRLHCRDLVGTPDIVLPRHKTIIFVHGCFWHRHPGCSKATTPKKDAMFWTSKFKKNVARDAKNETLLRAAGWRVITIWECETTNSERLERCLAGVFDM